MSALLSFQGVSLGYGAHLVLHDLNFTIEEGQYLGLVGANGAGKSTLLKAIIGALSPLQGRIVYQGQAKRSSLRLGYMPQQQTLPASFPLTVEQVALMGRYPQMGWRPFPRPSDRQAVRRALELVGIANLAPRPIEELSGGQWQRLLLARALTSEPQLLLLDEPTNGLDYPATLEFLALIDQLHAQGLTIILVTHQLEIVRRHTQKMGLIHPAPPQGNTLSWADPHHLEHPHYLAQLFGRSDLTLHPTAP